MQSTTTNTRALAAVAAGVLAAGLAVGYLVGHLVGQGTSSDQGSTPTLTTVAARASATDHNAPDVAFAQQMIPHHRQALAMAKLADTRAASPAVKTLAAQIEAAQQPEIDTMTGWLRAWGAPASGPAATGGMSGMGEGMMSAQDMTSLARLSGAPFDKEFLTMMVGHHSGAIVMARDELAHGKDARALALAGSIQVTQQAEVDQMRSLLGS